MYLLFASGAAFIYWPCREGEMNQNFLCSIIKIPTEVRSKTFGQSSAQLFMFKQNILILNIKSSKVTTRIVQYKGH